MTLVQHLFWTHLPWILSGGGLVILVALLVFVPGAWAAVFAFLRTTFGKIITIFAVSAVAVFFTGWVSRGYVDARDVERAEQKRMADVAQALLDQATQNEEVAAKAAKRIEETDRANRKLQDKLDDYVHTLAGRKDARCALSPDDVRRLRELGGASHPARRPG